MKYAYVSIYLAVVLAADLGLSLLPAPRDHGRLLGGGGLSGLPVPLWGQHQQSALYRLRPGPPGHPQLCHPPALPHRELPRLHRR